MLGNQADRLQVEAGHQEKPPLQEGETTSNGCPEGSPSLVVFKIWLAKAMANPIAAAAAVLSVDHRGPFLGTKVGGGSDVNHNGGGVATAMLWADSTANMRPWWKPLSPVSLTQEGDRHQPPNPIAFFSSPGTDFRCFAQ